MVTISRIEPHPKGWMVKVDSGFVTEIYGPYRWKWLARLVAWLEDGEH